MDTVQLWSPSNNNKIASDVSQLALRDGSVFIKNSEGVLRIVMKGGEYEQLSCQDGRMLVYDGRIALVCAQAKAVYLKFEDVCILERRCLTRALMM